ncbi:MAG: phosphoglucosamine mutase [Gammaproteobacteria bacterium]|jgi:phosphoglucosamine mutase|nr:phosphoglucosamine mutase [Gammaproteobacteria bacterium]MDG0965910.1 phosphoglucosamine mutase [SAR86 cluster bacterium]|tara:strand:- start:1715 stop:3031 length:1317 start_codon:yes stop_codon:yes gene_type:complete
MTIKFGTDGIRGPVESEITPEVCLRIGHAAGVVLKEMGWETVLIGKDTRVSGYMLESALQAGFIASGVNVRLLGPLPTPGVAYLTRSLRNQFGLVISASHNDYLDNGIKLFAGTGEKISKDAEKKIEKLLEGKLKPVPTAELGKARRFDESGDRYIEFCKSTVPADVSFDSLRIVLDCANGACYKVSPSVLRELGAEVICIGTDPDGYNINHECGSTYPERAQDEVIKQRADFGIALDGDGDRVVLIDRDGNILDGDDIMYILAYANPNRTGAWSGIVGTAMTNLGFEEGVKKLGYKFKRADVGDKYVSQMLQKEGWMLGGEPSGHIICRDLVSTGDGTIAALKVISSLLILEKDPAEILRNYSKMPQINISVNVKNKDILSDSKIQQKIKEIESDLTVGRVLVRASGTESKIRVMVESDDATTASKYAKDIAEMFAS